MRRLAAAIIFIVFLFAACAPAPVEFSPPRSFTRGYLMTADGQTAEGTFEARSFNDLRFSFTGPAGLAYFSCKADETGLDAGVDVYTDRIDYDELPDDAPMKILPAALRRALFENVPFVKTENGYETTIEIGAGTCAVRFDENGALTEVRDEKHKLDVLFFEKDDQNDRTRGEEPH